ncbi:TSUP family transporter [Aureliella helgolandensis]|uniref:Probable membrane transporter protein n=1 Tax=Aureliella helgolandensis TaxID=2527968 RepID=A0A518G5Y2_9BACT|nr:TSUP family transporter [Aureliella helgolandensis]QDV23979.1 Sulfite exporter TauE/SafE [Aureliella helgolandensis]
MFLAQNFWGELDDWLANCLDVLPQQFIAFATQEWSPDQWSPRVLISILILAGSAFVQATVGFAAALFGLPLLLWAGNSLVEAQVMIITAMLAQNFLSVWKLRRSIDLREVVVPAAIRISALPIGVAGLGFVMTWSAAAVNQLVGGIILFAVALQSLVGIEWKNANKPIWVAATFGGSGILQGLSGMSGPPMVLWVHGQRFSADRARAFLFSMYISNFGPQMALLTWRFGFSVWYSAGIALLSVPLVIVGALLGLRLGSWFGDRWLRPITYLCLIVLAVSSMLEPWLNRP